MGYPDMMRDVMESVIREQVVKKKKEMESVPIIDAVTGFYNEKYFFLRLEEEMARVKYHGNFLSLIMLEHDYFKKREGVTGNPDGHKTLKSMSDIIISCIRDRIDLAFRCHEDKFAIILPETSKQEADYIAHNIQQKMKNGRLGEITLRMGVVQGNECEHTFELIQLATDALCE